VKNEPKNFRFYLKVTLWVVAAVAIFSLFAFNWEMTRVSLFGLTSFWMPGIILWLLFLFIGMGIGYYFRIWETRSKQNKKGKPSS